ncbi:hypothetical protein Ciccas_003815 [Cichlidogyrus casuarinus]|uniref:Uncharacterized protein n=1 Tax=Cichlidogyrus casuarinus TaxID=1844966 RepID=A0ABD2QDA3_9PLAT
MNFLKGLTNDLQQSVSSVASEGNNLFSGTGSLFDSVKSKTENLVTDFSQKVDIGSTIDNIKRRTSIDQIGMVLKEAVGKEDTEEVPQSPKPIPPDKPAHPSDSHHDISKSISGDLQRSLSRENPFDDKKKLTRVDSKPMPSRPPPPRGASVDVGAHDSKRPSLSGSRSTSMDGHADSPHLMNHSIPVDQVKEQDEPSEDDEPFVDNDPEDSSASEYGGDAGSKPVYVDKAPPPETVDAVLANTVKEEPDSLIVQEFMDAYVAAVVNGE